MRALKLSFRKNTENFWKNIMLSMMKNMCGIDFLKGNNNLSLFQSLRIQGLLHTELHSVLLSFRASPLERLLNNNL